MSMRALFLIIFGLAFAAITAAVALRTSHPEKVSSVSCMFGQIPLMAEDVTDYRFDGARHHFTAKGLKVSTNLPCVVTQDP
jgi:hypothetical protein